MSLAKTNRAGGAGIRSFRRSGFGLLILAAAVQLGMGGDSGKRLAGDGRGLARFGDRGLTTFGDRGLTQYSDRGLISFSDTPLISMGGLRQEGVRRSDNSRSNRVRASRSNSRRSFGTNGSSQTWMIDSQAMLRASTGATFGFSAVLPILMPAIEPPAVVFDHEPAAADLGRTLDEAMKRAIDEGNLDLARSLEPDRR